MTDAPPTGIEAAIQKYGTQVKMSEETGISQQLISYWKRRGRIPAERVHDLSKMTGVPKRVLRPDLFGGAK